MTQISKKKPYDIVVQIEVKECLKVYIRHRYKIHHGSHENLKSGIDSRSKTTAELKTQTVIFQKNAFLLLLLFTLLGFFTSALADGFSVEFE